MEIPIEAAGCASRVGILRLRNMIRFANPIAPLRMTEPSALRMTGPAGLGMIVILFLCSAMASATTYYVSSSAGNDGNNGTSSSSAWQTVGHVNSQTFQPGDSILFNRGDVWNESLIPPSSGSSGNPITFDAYGTGPAPNLTGYYAVPATAWVLVTGNAWKAAVPSKYSTINFCLFGSIWGQKVSASSSNLTAEWDFYLANGYVYVYSVGNPATFYGEPIVPMGLSNVPVINVNGKSWLTFQHFLVNWFDEYGVYVQGASDHLVFANMEADSMIPQGTQPLGFYVDENAPGPGDIKIYNSEAHLNYDGFRFDGAATAITMVNDKGYANRDGALVDNTGAVTYSYCHFYASSLAVAGSTDVESTSGMLPTAGAGNIAADTAPAVQLYQRYPAMVTLTVDDAGMTPGADTYYAGTVLPVADAAGVPVGAAITVGYPLAQTLISEFQEWINAGRDVTSHSMSHTYYTNTDALDIQYTGSGTAANLSISNKVLTISVTGANDSVSYNLGLPTGQTVGTGTQTILGLYTALNNTGKFSASLSPLPCQGPYGTGCSAYTGAALLSQDLANVSGQDVKSAVYHMQLNVTQLTTDEITLSRQWMTTNLTGLPATPVYVYPGGYETTTMQGITAGVPYGGARGALKEDLGVKDTYADGFNAENITSFGVNPSWMGITPAALNQHIQALVWKEAVWGVPWGIFWHLNELTQDDAVGGTEITNLIADFQDSGATIQTNTGLVNWLLTGTQATGTDGNDYYKIPATTSAFSSNGGLDFRPTRNSPVVDAGQNLGAAYELDINGVNQNSYGAGWEIGAHVYEGYSAYGEGMGPGDFEIGGDLAVGVALPQAWVNNNEGNALFSYELSLPGTWVTGPAPSCTFHAPYWTSPTLAGLQSAVNDAEACRTATGAGIALDIPPALYSSTSGLVIPQTNSVTSTAFLVLRSAQDPSLPDGQIVCAHGMQDNLATSTDISIDNPDCTGQNMYYTLGPTSVAADAGSGTNNNCVSATMSGAIATFTLQSGTNCATVFPASFTIGNIIQGFSFVPATYRSNWTILSGGAGSSSLTAQSCPYAPLSATLACIGPVSISSATISSPTTAQITLPSNVIFFSGQGIVISGITNPSLAQLNGTWTVASVPGSALVNLTGSGWTTESATALTAGSAALTATTTNGNLNTLNVISGWTTVSVNTTTLQVVTSTQVAAGIPILIPLNNGFVASGIPLVVDTGGNQETVTTVSGTNQVGMFATFTKAHAFGVPVCYNANQGACAGSSSGSGAFTLANGIATNVSNYNDVQYMWTAESTADNAPFAFCLASGVGSTPACATNIGPDHWLIEDMEARPQIGNSNDLNIINTGAIGANTNTGISTAQLPSHIHLRKVWAHCDWTMPYVGTCDISGGIHMGANYFSIVDSAVTQMFRPGVESHGIDYGLTGLGKVNHNYLISPASISSLCGGLGASSLLPSGFVTCDDLEIRRNRLGHPFAWLGIDNTGNNLNATWGNSNSTVFKDILEFKSGQRILIDGNILDGSDNSGAQNGPIGDADTSNSSGGGAGTHYGTVISDYTFSNTMTRNTCSGFLIAGRGQDAGGGAALPGGKFYIHNNLFYSITDTDPGCWSADKIGHQIGTYASEWGGTVCPNVAYNGGSYTLPSSTNLVNCAQAAFTASSLTSTFIATCITKVNCPFGASTSSTTGGLGVGVVAGYNSSSNTATFTVGGGFNFAAATGQQLLVVNCSVAAYNTASWTITTATTSQIQATSSVGLGSIASATGCALGMSYTNLPGVGGDQTDIAVGDPVTFIGCGNTNLDTPALSISGYNGPGPGPLALIGTNGLSAYGVMVVYPTPSSSGISSGDVGCTLDLASGSPKNFVYTHNTLISDKQAALTAGAGGQFSQYGDFQNNFWVSSGGWQDTGTSVPEGTSTETVNWLTSELTNAPDVWVGRPASSYTEFGNNPSYPDSAGCTGSGCNPPLTMYFPTTSNCTGSTPTSSCVGFTGAMSTSTMPLTLSDYHNWALIAGSSFKAGGATPASDGTDMGTNIDALDSAQTANVFVCSPNCLTNPYPDFEAPFQSILYGMSENGIYPTQTYTMQRFWDTPHDQWPDINTASGVYSFTNLDADLATAYSNGTTLGFYTLARTPTWASSAPTDTACNYTGTDSGEGDGECDPPIDLNSDGSGSDAVWIAWITKIAQHANGQDGNPTYLTNHAHIRYWEIWNEPDTKAFWAGSIAQLARMTEDANCIITGRGVIHPNGNGTSVACTATAIDATAQIVMASAHAKTVALTYGQNELYCNNTSGIPSYELPCPNPANIVANTVDIINFHMKPGNESGNNCPAPTLCTLESAMQWYASNINGILATTELAKPLWDGESQFSSTGFTGAYTDVNMAASVPARFYLMAQSLGIVGDAWYYANSISQPTSVGVAYQQFYNWTAGAQLIEPCSANGTVWSCQIFKSGIPYLVMWDTAQSCAGTPSVCTTGNQTVANQWVQSQDMTAASAAAAINGHVVAVGIKPVVIH